MDSEARPVLLCYDGSPDARRAIEGAAALFGGRRAIVAHVWQSLSGLLLGGDVDELSGVLREAATELDSSDAKEADRVAREGAEIASGLGFEAIPRAVCGERKLWSALTDLAEQEDCAAVVVGARGLSPVKSALLGSVSQAVLQHSSRPVLVVPLDEGPGEQGGPALLAYDGSDPARAAIETAGGLLPARQAAVIAVWRSAADVSSAALAAAPSGVVHEAAARADEALHRNAQQTAEEGAVLARAAGFEQVQATAARAVGNIGSTLASAAEERAAGLLVLGSRGRGMLAVFVLGSVSRTVAAHAPVPVLVVPRAGYSTKPLSSA